jgi:hypothetical protein
VDSPSSLYFLRAIPAAVAPDLVSFEETKGGELAGIQRREQVAQLCS